MTLVGIRGGEDGERAELTRALLGHLKARGHSVSVLAFAGVSADIDIPGKDSYEHRRAGAREVLAVSRLRWALMHESPPETAPAQQRLDMLLARLAPVEFVLAPGTTGETGISLDLERGGEVLRATHGARPAEVFRLDMAGQIADFIHSSPAEKHPAP
ncbi:MAG: molybdopterin-guanine dinucleotide biosynthesis protein MobB [Alphaproteobacteria bacterium]|nr:molybdopterin-guanine dinucleotide biosynthesis protein MobB [Alphaproteobacteria bacterium]